MPTCLQQQPTGKSAVPNTKSRESSCLVDTGAGLSVLPPLEIDKPHKGKGKNLRAANGSEIATYGERAVKINFGLGRTYNYVFHVADVTTPFLGVDFLAACNFNINVHNATVTDKYTNQSTMLCIVYTLQEGPSIAGLGASALTSQPQ